MIKPLIFASDYDILLITKHRINAHSETHMYYEIKTERLLLRPLNISDLNTVHEYASDYENTRYMMWLPNRTIEETAEFLNGVAKEWEKDEPSFHVFAVVLNGSQIGAVSVYLNDDRTIGELGWILNKKFQKKGYAYESALAIKDFALNTVHLKKLVAQCDHRNAPSYRLMERIGLKLESDDGLRTYLKRKETARELTYGFTVE